MKQVFRSQYAIAALMLVFGAFSYAVGQNPDPFVTQVTSSGAGGAGNAFGSWAGDISGDGRFVVIESNGDISTEKTSSRNNADGNREIFLLDYAQRRIFQITNTTSALKPPASPSPTPTPSASPTPTPAPTPTDPATIAVEVSNNRPVLSNNGRWIAFSSNADTPGSFDGNANSAALANDGNQEIFIYFVPATPPENLSSGNEAAFTDLAAGTFTRITDTPASRKPIAGTASALPFVADDNRDAMVNDNASVIAFVSTRDLISGGNPDGNPEIFVYRRTPAALTQVTNTADVFANGRLVGSIFNENPSLSGSGSVLAFISNANITGENNDSQGFGNAEIYLASYDQTTASSTVTRQVTKTKKDAFAATVNVLSPGRRISRDGTMIAFETLADTPTSATNKFSYGVFIYNITATAAGAADTFVAVGPRALAGGDVIHFPTFTDYDVASIPHSLVFTSALNFKADGTFPPADQDSTGLNPAPSGQFRPAQIFVTPLSTTFTFARLTKNPTAAIVAGIRPFPSNTRDRVAFSLGASELGGGNADLSTEVFYLLSRLGTDAPEALSFFTGASEFPVATATPVPSPAPSPTPVPVSSNIGSGLAAGELSIIRSTVALAPGSQAAGGGPETTRSPILPIELNGVSVAINGAAAGLYSVGGTAAEGIKFVMPIGLSTGVASVVVNNNGTTYRGFVQILDAQPDLFTMSDGFGSNRAVICNVTDPTIPGCVIEPFTVTSLDSTSTSVATVLEIHLTGVRKVIASEAKVRIGTTDINVNSVGPNTNMFGFDFIRITLPASLAGAGDVPVIVTITKGGTTYSSRAADTAPRVRIN